MKKLTFLLTSLVMLLALCAGQALAFDDLEGYTPEQVAAVEKLAEMGVMQGDGEGNFWPGDPIDRAEFAKVASLMAIKMNGHNIPVVSAPDFRDVSSKAWYALDVATAVELGLMRGDADGLFRPSDPVTGYEVVTVMLRALGYNDEELTGEWPKNYLDKARELGLIAGADHFYAVEFNRIQVAELAAALPELAETLNQPGGRPAGNQEKPDDAVVKRDHGVLTADVDLYIDVFGFETGAGRYRTTEATLWQAPRNEMGAGQVIYFTLNKDNQVVSVSKQSVFTYAGHEADIKNGTVWFGGNGYKIEDGTDVLLMNGGGGVSRVAVDKLLESNYVADLRSASYGAPLQYVLEGSKLVGLLIGDYKGQNGLHFGYIENYGEGVDGMQVQFFGDENDYNWRYVGTVTDKPQTDRLYAYRFRANRVEAYMVGEKEGLYPEIKGGVVKNSGNIYLTEDGKQFVVADDTVVMRVSQSSDGRIYDVSYDEEVSSGDVVDVRYKVNGDLDIEAVYVIIFD